MATANLSNVAVAIDSSKESMKELRWALDSLRLRPDDDGDDESRANMKQNVLMKLRSSKVLRWAAVLGAQGVAEVSVFMQAIESHERRIPEAILEHALKIFSDKNVEVKTQVVVGDPKKKICEMTTELKVDLLVMGCRAFGPIKRHETV
ncbi:Peptidyl-prolyl isomerase FKBP12 [Hordeum vulgare]|nr:Peptidyl-prolyl isomerase FKBP12 [Hordeum vulgare]